jgi:hypothetical protein
MTYFVSEGPGRNWPGTLVSAPTDESARNLGVPPSCSHSGCLRRLWMGGLRETVAPGLDHLMKCSGSKA